MKHHLAAAALIIGGSLGAPRVDHVTHLVRPSPQAVALTAYAGAGDRARALSHGYRAFVPKPVEPAELVKVVADLCRDGRGVV